MEVYNMEIWKDVKGYEGYQEVSNIGNVRSVDRMVKHSKGGLRIYKGKMLVPYLSVDGYRLVHLSKLNVSEMKRVNRLVAEAFIPNPMNLATVNHKDENKLNDSVENLEWMSVADNIRYSCCKSINQLSINGDFIQTWKSASEVNKELNFNTSNILRCCKGLRKSAHGYKWCYVDGGE